VDDGMVPVKMLSDRSKYESFVFCPILDGIEPTIKFTPKSSLVKSLRKFTPEGKVPDIWLSCIVKNDSDTKLPRDEGRLPLSLLKSNERTFKALFMAGTEGIEPVRLF